MDRPYRTIPHFIIAYHTLQAWKLRAVTPQLSPASVVGFNGNGGGECGSSSPSGAGSYDNFEYVTPQTSGEVFRPGMTFVQLHASGHVNVRRRTKERAFESRFDRA